MIVIIDKYGRTKTVTSTVLSAHAVEHEASGSDEIDHDSLSGFVANEHIDWTADQGATNLHSGNIPDLSATYATAAKGVTNGDSHNHVGGDGAQVDHGGMGGLGDDDHSQYHNDARGDARYGLLGVLNLGAILTTNGTYKGIIITGTVDTNSVGVGACLAQAADFHWDEADADAVANTYGLVLACETSTGSKILLLLGQLCNTAWNWSAGLVFLSTTAGTLTQTAPTGEDDVVIPVGFALSADTVYFNPGMFSLEYAA